MDEDFHARASRVAAKAPPMHAPSRKSSGAFPPLLGGIFGISGGLLVNYANANYEASAAFAPILLAVAGFLAISAFAAVVGLLSWAFGRRWLIRFFCADVVGFGLGSLSARVANGLGSV